MLASNIHVPDMIGGTYHLPLMGNNERVYYPSDDGLGVPVKVNRYLSNGHVLGVTDTSNMTLQQKILALPFNPKEVVYQ